MQIMHDFFRRLLIITDTLPFLEDSSKICLPFAKICKVLVFIQEFLSICRISTKNHAKGPRLCILSKPGKSCFERKKNL